MTNGLTRLVAVKPQVRQPLLGDQLFDFFDGSPAHRLSIDGIQGWLAKCGRPECQELDRGIFERKCEGRARGVAITAQAHPALALLDGYLVLREKEQQAFHILNAHVQLNGCEFCDGPGKDRAYQAGIEVGQELHGLYGKGAQAMQGLG